MGRKVNVSKFESYQEFYKNAVIKLKKEHPDYLRLDGCKSGSNRNPFAYFIYQDQCWKVDADTWIEKLEIAAKLFDSGEDPFLIKSTRGQKNQCLTIQGQAEYRKKFYVYLTGLSTG